MDFIVPHMKKLFLIANWKSYKTTPEALRWLQTINDSQLTIDSNNKEAVVCPPFTLLAQMNWFIKTNNLPIKLGAQDISPFGEGAYTGEVNGKQIKEIADYAIIGHSERRNNFSESDELLDKKVQMALQSGLTSVFCIQNEKTPVPQGVTVVAYEPVFAIGSGQPDTPESANRVAETVKREHQIPSVLYGGSVTGENVHDFTQMPSIDGVLVGGASLDAKKFMRIIENS